MRSGATPAAANRARYSSCIDSRPGPTMSSLASARRSSSLHHSVTTRGPIFARLENAPSVGAPCEREGGRRHGGTAGRWLVAPLAVRQAQQALGVESVEQSLGTRLGVGDAVVHRV